MFRIFAKLRGEVIKMEYIKLRPYKKEWQLKKVKYLPMKKSPHKLSKA